MKEDVYSKDMTEKLVELERMIQNISEFSQEFGIEPLYGMFIRSYIYRDCIDDMGLFLL